MQEIKLVLKPLNYQASCIAHPIKTPYDSDLATLAEITFLWRKKVLSRPSYIHAATADAKTDSFFCLISKEDYWKVLK